MHIHECSSVQDIAPDRNAVPVSVGIFVPIDRPAIEQASEETALTGAE